ncbi:MAG TPA: extracellular solute-binding protein [Steroidobacteraceae bacterium]|nr:extracellular solute-binding protein [Steroidobacteraceae bacterium]
MSTRSTSGAWWLGAALMSLSAYAPAGDLTVISFGRADRAALVKAYIDPFAKSTGINTHSLSYDGQVTELTQMVRDGAPVWDVMQVESRTLAQGCRQGLFEKLDPARLTLPKDLIPGAVSECGVGIFAWAQALVYSDKLKQAPHSWADFWDTHRFPGKRGLRRSAKYTMEIALLADGVAPKDVYRTLSTEAGVNRAFRKLEQIKKDTVWWEAAAQPGALMAAGWVNMSSAYTLWFDPEQEKNQHTRIVWRQSLYDIDSWAIPKGSPKRDDAYRFIAFASAPQQQKVLSENMTYGPTNRAALDLLPPQLVGNLPSSTANLADALRIDSAFWIEHGDALERRFNSWAPAMCRQQDEEDDDYFDQPECQDPRGIMRVNKGISASPIGQPGNPKEVSRTITVTMNDTMRFAPDRIEVQTGETIRFVVQNKGQLRHELVLGEPEALRRHAAMMLAMPDMIHSGPNMVSLAPGEQGQVVWRFTRAGFVAFACLQPGHLDAGMKGGVAVH